MEEEMKTELESISQNYNQLSSKFSALESACNESKEELKDLSSSVEKKLPVLTTKISEIDEKLADSTKKLDSYINEHNKIDSSVEGKIGTIEVYLQNQYSELNEERLKLQSDYNFLLQKNGKLEADVESLKRDLSVEKTNSNEKQSLISQLNSDISKERDNSVKLSGKIQLLEAELEKTNENLNNSTEKIKRLSYDIDLKENEVKSKSAENTQLSQQIEKLQGDYNSLSNHYKSLDIEDTLLVAFTEFLSLTDKTKASIETLFPKTSFLGFISAALRLSNISSLWETAKRNIFNNNLEDIEKINKIFSLLITIYNEGSKESQFQVISPEIGSKYDSSTSAIKEMKSSGTVKKVLLVGFKNIKDGNVHKAIISVDD